MFEQDKVNHWLKGKHKQTLLLFSDLVVVAKKNKEQYMFKQSIALHDVVAVPFQSARKSPCMMSWLCPSRVLVSRLDLSLVQGGGGERSYQCSSKGLEVHSFPSHDCMKRYCNKSHWTSSNPPGYDV